VRVHPLVGASHSKTDRPRAIVSLLVPLVLFGCWQQTYQGTYAVMACYHVRKTIHMLTCGAIGTTASHPWGGHPSRTRGVPPLLACTAYRSANTPHHYGLEEEKEKELDNGQDCTELAGRRMQNAWGHLCCLSRYVHRSGSCRNLYSPNQAARAE